jgi:hypothetical protein
MLPKGIFTASPVNITGKIKVKSNYVSYFCGPNYGAVNVEAN